MTILMDCEIARVLNHNHVRAPNIGAAGELARGAAADPNAADILDVARLGEHSIQ